MPRLSSRGEDGAMLEQLPPNCDLIFDTHVFDYMLHELHRLESTLATSSQGTTIDQRIATIELSSRIFCQADRMPSERQLNFFLTESSRNTYSDKQKRGIGVSNTSVPGIVITATD
jgi:hypothetical protein